MPITIKKNVMAYKNPSDGTYVGVDAVNDATLEERIGAVESELEDKYEKPANGIPATDIASGVIPDVSGKTDQGAVATPYGSLTWPVTAGQYCFQNGYVYRAKQDIATSESWTAAHWDQVVLGDEVCRAMNAIQGKPDVMETEEDSSLYVTDEDGYAIVEFKDGHIKTQNFDSKETVKAAQSEYTDSDAKLNITDERGYSIVEFLDGHIKTKNFDSKDHNLIGTEYKLDNGTLMLAYGYTDTHDAVIVLNSGRANGLFDFSALMLKQKGKLLKDCTNDDFTYVWSSSTDMHSPFQFLAADDPDGYYASATDPTYTGGNHVLEINGQDVQTASSKYVHFFADGVPITSGTGRCVKFEIRWANEVQAYNCVKADGTGRTSLVEYHDMIFDGIRFNEDVVLIPTEDIKMQFWEGFAFISWGTQYDHIRFIDGTNRGVFTSSDNNVKSGNAKTSGLVAWGDDHAVEMNVDTNIDLGKRDYYSYGQDSGAFASASSTKGYFTIIYKYTPFVEMNTGEAYKLRGSFRFYPVVD